MTRISWLLVLPLLALAGCRTVPVSERFASHPAPPAAWRQPAPAVSAPLVAPSAAAPPFAVAAARPPAALPATPGDGWWRNFGSAELAEMVEAAQRDSFDLAAAIARVGQADAASRVAGAARLPVLSTSLEASGGGRADGLARGSVAPASGAAGNTASTGGAYGLAFRASYEVDLWGGNRARDDSAAALLQASRHARDAARLAVTASVAAAWLQSAGLRDRLGVADSNLASAERMLAMVASRSSAGAAHPLELAQQRGLVAAQRRQRAELAQQLEDSRTTLAILLGRTVAPAAPDVVPVPAVSPGPAAADPAVATIPAAAVAAAPYPAPAARLADPAAATAANANANANVAPPAPSLLASLRLPAIDAGLPSALLARRPDIAQAEAQLAAADADIIAARAAMLPSVALGGILQSSGHRPSGLLDNPLYSLAASLAAPIFNGGRLAAQRDLAAARRAELLAGYRSAIVAAFGDVERALNALSSLAEQHAAQEEELAQASRAFDLASARYRAGADSALTLLDAQRTLYAAQDAALQLRLARLQASVALYRALGGGWQIDTGNGA